MREASARVRVVLEPGAALALWSDVERWSTFVEGFAHPVERSPGWPAEGERLSWQSTPGGRGRVTEKVVASDGEQFATMVFEDALMGRQTLRARPGEDGGARLELSLEYTLTKYGPLGPLADTLFIRRALRDSLRRTLGRFAVEAEEEAGLR